jgi:hypothetical protein
MDVSSRKQAEYIYGPTTDCVVKEPMGVAFVGEGGPHQC